MPPAPDTHSPDLECEVLGRLMPPDIEAVRALVGDATAEDGTAPLSEHVLLHLPRGGDEQVRNVLLRRRSSGKGGQVLAYAHLDVTDAVDGSSAELVVAPAARGQGLGARLVRSLLDETPDGRLRLWAHGDTPAAARVAATLGFRRSRVLFQMRRVLNGPGAEPLPAAATPDGVVLRTFEPGRDERAWTAVNNRAFADHPDQGGWGVEEVELREKEPWFDPAGFFLAERDGVLVGFHWTKVHGGRSHPGTGDGADHDHDPIGEVYIVGVDPSEQGRGLGPWLTLLGLRSLQERGLAEVLLYVDEANTNAIRVYERLGFTRHATDVMWARP